MIKDNLSSTEVNVMGNMHYATMLGYYAQLLGQAKMFYNKLDEMRKASSLAEASNVDKKLDEVKLRKILEKEKYTKERNKAIFSI